MNVQQLSIEQFNARQFIQINFELILDEFQQCESAKLTRLLKNEKLFENLCLYLKEGNLVCFTYMQVYLKEVLLEFIEEMKQYFA
tara:strand:- start:773 stop:1027 length:255 start_codon:yes stop_codon:yes gene_type:complete